TLRNMGPQGILYFVFDETILLVTLWYGDPNYNIGITNLINSVFPTRFRFENYQQLQAMRYAVEEINQRSDLLPNITLGFYAYDSCAALQSEIKGTLWMLTGKTEEVPNYCCRKSPPLISYFSTSSLLSDRTQFSSFFRTVPSDVFQSRGLAHLVLHFNWTWVGLIASNDDYGYKGLEVIKQEITKGGACVAYIIYMSRNPMDQNIHNIVQVIKESSARVLVAFCTDVYLIPVLDEMLKQNVTGKSFIASEAWSISNVLSVPKYSSLLSGTIGFAFHSSTIPGFQRFLNSINPLNTPGTMWSKFFWEEAFGCTFSNQTNSSDIVNALENPCTGDEDLENLQNSYNDVSNLRASYNIYTAVYVIAKALDDLNHCQTLAGPLFNKYCATLENFEPWQVHHYGEISNQTDSIECWKCPWDMWPNSKRDRCFPKPIEFLSYDDSLGITLAAISVFSCVVPLAIFRLFIHYKSTPIVRANNHLVSCVLLVSLSFCFLCALAFIGYPQPEKCLLRQAAFGLVFTLCVSCILAKTIIVVFAFMATKPGSSLKKWTTPRVPYMIITICTFIQLTLCVIWLTISPPFPQYNSEAKPGIIFVECDENSPYAFWCMLGYLGFLASVSFTVAFLARRLPDNFNEAKLITFSMLAFLSVWVYFIPASLSAQGKYTVAMEIFAILTSTWALVICMFLPKCFVILFRPNMNSKENLMGKDRRKEIKKKIIF
uniref:Extracellular calcium-sensing receptor n=1 Tax=Xenopus tropicalis TaxID=8364 RepID=L7N373_XENTR